MAEVFIERKIHFNSTHRLHAHDLSEKENKNIFGKCNNPNGHGHNYTLIVTLKGAVDPITGLVVNLTQVKSILNETIMAEFDHKNLNLDTSYFTGLVPTAENIVVIC